MNLRWLILFVALAAPAFGRDLELSGSAATTLGGERSRGNITFRIGERVKGGVTIGALNRRVPFRDRITYAGKVRVKIATRDGLRGSLAFSLASKAPGHGRISIPGQGVARVSFRAQPPRDGSEREQLEGSWHYEALNPSGPIKRFTADVALSSDDYIAFYDAGWSPVGACRATSWQSGPGEAGVAPLYISGPLIVSRLYLRKAPIELSYRLSGKQYSETFDFVIFRPF